MVVVVGSRLISAPGLQDFHNLAVYYHSTADNAEYDKQDRENARSAKPSIQKASHKQAENDTAGHGQPELCHDLQVFRPGAILLVVEEFPGSHE